MKSRLIMICLLLAALPLKSQSQTTVLFESFEDRDLTNNPLWTGDLDDFKFWVPDANTDGNTLLQLNANSDPSRTQIYTQSSVTAGLWEFYVRQDFLPSNFNRAFIFLMADKPDLNYLDGSDVSGYALRTGDNETPRKFRLVRFDDGDQTELITSETIIEENTGYSIRVTRSLEGEWRLYIAPGINSPPEIDGGPHTDLTYTLSSYFGILLRYSSGNVSNVYFDNIRIQNSASFQLTRARVITATSIELQFNYPVEESSLESDNFFIPSLGIPGSTELGNSPGSVLLSYQEAIADGDYKVQVKNLESIYGNEILQPAEAEFSFINPFSLVQAEITSNRTIDVHFTRPVHKSSTGISDFSINQAVNPSTIQIDSSRVELRFSDELPSGEITIAMSPIKSEEGWQLPIGSSISTYRFGEATARDVVINEFLYRRAPPEDIQFVELYNTTDTPLNLGGWSLITDRGSAEIPNGTVLKPTGYFLLTDGPSGFEATGNAIELQGFVPLRTTGDAIILKDKQKLTIDSLTYEPEWGGNTAGISLERKDPHAISPDPSNWTSANSGTRSTPLEINTRFQPDTFPPELLFAKLLPLKNSVLVRFNEFINSDDPLNITLNGQDVSVKRVYGIKRNELIIEASDFESRLRSEILLAVDQATDYQGNISTNMQLPVAQPMMPGDLVFNEIMFDPLDSDFDQIPNQSDYVELFNRRSFAISLEGIFLHDIPDENGEIRSMTPISSQSKWIPGTGFALIYPENEPVAVDSSRIGRFFSLSKDITPHAIQIGRSTLSLPLSGREIYLADSLSSVIDKVHYNEQWHNPNLLDTKGIALERINPEGETANESNWGSSTVPAGGTPGLKNSLFQTPGALTEMNTLEVTPNPFSPDADGHEDRLFINYLFEDPNYMLRVRIFDRYGRHVRSLAHSLHAGFEGSLTWDGRHDDGVTGRIGIYIVHIEAFNSSTGDKKQFKKVAVLARQF